jgi:hypothetical protein
MTELATIHDNHLALECRQCGRWRLVPVIDLIERVGGHRSPHWVAERSVCTSCGSRGAIFQIIYVSSPMRVIGAVSSVETTTDEDATLVRSKDKRKSCPNQSGSISLAPPDRSGSFQLNAPQNVGKIWIFLR